MIFAAHAAIPPAWPLRPRAAEGRCCLTSAPILRTHIGFSPHTLKPHIINIFDKINVSNRIQAGVLFGDRLFIFFHVKRKRSKRKRPCLANPARRPTNR